MTPTTTTTLPCPATCEDGRIWTEIGGRRQFRRCEACEGRGHLLCGVCGEAPAAGIADSIPSCQPCAEESGRVLMREGDEVVLHEPGGGIDVVDMRATFVGLAGRRSYDGEWMVQVLTDEGEKRRVPAHRIQAEAEIRTAAVRRTA